MNLRNKQSLQGKTISLSEFCKEENDLERLVDIVKILNENLGIETNWQG
jgi:hypothetical protein